MKEVRKKMDELIKLNSEVNKTDKKEFEEVKKDIDDAAVLQEGAEKEVNDGSPKSGGKKQEKASEKMNDAKEKLSKLKKNQKKKQKAEDAKMMRRLLENVIFLSFEQEKILEKTKTTSIQSPSYLKLIQYQQKIKEDFKLVEDTLYKIASRQAKIRKFIFEEVDKVNSNTDLAIKRLVDRRIDLAISNEQFTMSAYNKLGLMLSESLKNMQDEDEDEIMEAAIDGEVLEDIIEDDTTEDDIIEEDLPEEPIAPPPPPAPAPQQLVVSVKKEENEHRLVDDADQRELAKSMTAFFGTLVEEAKVDKEGR